MVRHRLRSLFAQRLASIGMCRMHSQALPERWEGLGYKQHGPPQDVLRLEGLSSSSWKLQQNHGSIAVEMLAVSSIAPLILHVGDEVACARSGVQQLQR